MMNFLCIVDSAAFANVFRSIQHFPSLRFPLIAIKIDTILATPFRKEIILRLILNGIILSFTNLPISILHLWVPFWKRIDLRLGKFSLLSDFPDQSPACDALFFNLKNRAIHMLSQLTFWMLAGSRLVGCEQRINIDLERRKFHIFANVPDQRPRTVGATGAGSVATKHLA